jgi:hypothetical protein
MLKVIGKGGYAKVLMVKESKSDLIFAMKVLKKKYLGNNADFSPAEASRPHHYRKKHPGHSPASFRHKAASRFLKRKKAFLCSRVLPRGGAVQPPAEQKQAQRGLDAFLHQSNGFGLEISAFIGRDLQGSEARKCPN